MAVSQPHNYDLPATACIVQHRLGLSHACAAFDMSMGCSGYVYGSWVCSGIVTGGARRVLWQAGDTMSRACSPQNRSTAFLFGDAGAATALKRDANAPDMTFVLGTDGSGREFPIQPDSGFRNRATPGSSASMHVALSHRLGGQLRHEQVKLVLAGFGVGWSGGAAAATCGPMVMPEIIYLYEPAAQAAAS